MGYLPNWLPPWPQNRPQYKNNTRAVWKSSYNEFTAALLVIITDHNNMGGGHHHVTPGSEPRKDQDIQAIKDAKIPLAWRDTCSHILIGLNKCRRETWWNPNKCEHERHIYEECEYNAYLQRVEAKVQQDKVKAAQSD